MNLPLQRFDSKRPVGARSRALFDKRPRWGPTLRGWVVLLGIVVSLSAAVLFGIHRFLSVHAPVRGNVLVIEGWIPEYALRQCATIIQAGGYEHIVTIGGPVSAASSPANDDDTQAYVAIRILQRLGVTSGMHMVPTNIRDRDRTYQSASDLRKWLESRSIDPHGINVVTIGPHARRSRLLFQRVFRDLTPVGVIPITNREYEAERWWEYSEGIREVISESAAYLYARVLFHG